MAITHLFTSTKADGADNTIVQAGDWNDDHVGTISSAMHGTFASGDLHTEYGGLAQAESVTGLWNFIASGLGGLTDYDLTVGDVATPDYGLIRVGNSVMGRTSYNAGNMDVDGAFIIRNVGGPVTGQIEFLITESGASAIRFALAKSGVGNATYNPRSMLLAGPAVNNDDVVTVGYWQGQGIFDNLVCDTGGDGADLGVQNDLEVEGDIFVDSILESTTAVGVTIDSVLLKDGEVGPLSDNKAIIFGTTDRGTILYDGSHLRINPKAVGTGGLSIDGQVVLGGSLFEGNTLVLIDPLGGVGSAIHKLFVVNSELKDTQTFGYGIQGVIEYGGSAATVSELFGLTFLAKGANSGTTFTDIAGAVVQGSLSSGSATRLTGLWVKAGSVTAPATVRGIWIDTHPGVSGVTTVESLRIEDISSGTNRYPIRQVGTASQKNILAANTRIGGTTDPTVALDVTGAVLVSTTLGVTGLSTLIGGVLINQDNIAIIFGPDSDADILWNGTDLVINPRRVSVGAVRVSLADGDVRLGDVTGSANSDTGLLLNGAGSYESAVFTEVNGTLLSIGLNMSQIGSVVAGAAGGMLRIDVRAAQRRLTLIGQNAGSDEQTMFQVPLHPTLGQGPAFMRANNSLITLQEGVGFCQVDVQGPTTDTLSALRVIPKGTPAGAEMTVFEFFGTDSGVVNYVQLRFVHTGSEIRIRSNYGGTGGGGTDSPMIFDHAVDNASPVEAMRMDVNAQIIINEDGGDQDFRAEGASIDDVLLVDASADELITTSRGVLRYAYLMS